MIPLRSTLSTGARQLGNHSNRALPLCIGSEQKRFFETTESKINVAHRTNATRKHLYGEPLKVKHKKARVARKGVYRLKPKKKPWVWPKGKTHAEVNEENSKNNPPGTKKEMVISEEDRAYMDRIKECSRETGRMDEAIDCYHMMKMLPDTHTYVDMLNVFLVNSTPEKNYLGEALQIYQDTKKQGIQPSMEIYTILMDLCLMRKHMPRGIYIFKEFLAHIKVAKRNGKSWERQADKYVQLHKTLLRLCYECNSPERAAAIFEQMLHYHSHVIAYMSGETHVAKNPTIEFVKSFIEDKEQAESFAYRMREALKGHVVAENAKPSEVDYDNIPHAELMSALANNTALSPATRAMFAASSTSEDIFNETPNRGVIESTLDEAPFMHQATHFHEKDQTISKVHLELSRNIFEEARTEFNDFVNGNPHKEKLLGVTDDEAELLLMNAKEKMEFQLDEAMSIEDVKKIHDEYNEKKRHIQDKLSNRLNWKPIVIGVDGLPFFPTCMDSNRITGESVRAAKREYLESITDPEVRNDVEREFSDRIKIVWFDVDKQQVIDGLYY